MNKFAKNLFSTGGVTILSQLLTFGISIYLARIFTVGEVGQINVAQNMLVYFTMITLFGFQTWGIREIATNKEGRNEVVGNITLVRVLISMVCFIVCTMVAIVSSKTKGALFAELLIIYGLSIFLTAFNFNFYFSGIYDMTYNAVYNFIRNVIPFVLTVFLVKTSKDILWVPIFYVLGLFIAVIYQGIIYYIKGNRIKINRIKLKYTFVMGVPFLLSGILSMININVDSIMLMFLRGDVESGIYSQGYKVIFFLTNVIAIIFTPVFPMLTELYKDKGREKLNSFLNIISKVIILIAFPVMIGGIILSKDILILLFGHQYESGYVAFSILLVYIFILFMRELYAYSLNAWDYEKKYLRIISISAGFNFIVNLIFIPKFGMVAAAMVTLISEVITFISMRKEFKKEVNQSYTEHLKKALVPTISMGFVVVIMKILGVNTIINICVAGSIYLIQVIVTGYVSKKDISLLLNK